ncbi:MAG: hypothetical protein ABL949_15075 [Fimbriimonadaceae bacterium]
MILNGLDDKTTLNPYNPTAIQLHLVTGRKQIFYQEEAALVASICADIDGQHIFTRHSLIIEGAEDVLAFPGNALIGITVMTDFLPAAFLERELMLKTVVTQISTEAYHAHRQQEVHKTEGIRSLVYCELEFVTGERLFLEFNEIAQGGKGERNVLQHLFARPSLFCRTQEGGFSAWNTAHIVSWSHYPKLEAPLSAWSAESVPKQMEGQLVEAKLL